MQSDRTLTVADMINMFKKAKILDFDDRITLPDFLDVVEKYHTHGTGGKLSEKLTDANFKAFLKANPETLKINVEVAARREYLAKVADAEKEGTTCDLPEVAEIPEDVRREREETETAEAHTQWHADVLSQHLMFVKGAEVVF